MSEPVVAKASPPKFGSSFSISSSPTDLPVEVLLIISSTSHVVTSGLKIPKVLYIPAMTSTLFSLAQLLDLGFIPFFLPSTDIIFFSKNLCLKVTLRGLSLKFFSNCLLSKTSAISLLQQSLLETLPSILKIAISIYY
ncbi:hypothetical protein BY996DRAFT_3712320 [Phakopsora pachyrhizi]|nr:hypothetical protein BY996DRAFT_3712320 [Phakopsora pachyrhizi]